MIYLSKFKRTVTSYKLYLVSLVYLVLLTIVYTQYLESKGLFDYLM